MTIIWDDAPWPAKPCQHNEHDWRECYKHRADDHKECDICGALLYEDDV